MTTDEFASSVRPYVAAFTVFRKDGKMAFLLRQNTNWMNGHYGLPAGKVDHGESITQAAIREAKEEVGVEIKPENLKHKTTVFRTSYDDDPEIFWFDIVFEVTEWEGELYNAEPHKHSDLAWFDLENLPKNVAPYIHFYLEQVKADRPYAEYGWEG